MKLRNTNTINKLRRLGAVMLFSLIVMGGFAQIKKGDKMFSKFEYEKALFAYEKEYNSESTPNPYLTRRIGLTYRKLGDIESSAIWFKRTLDLDQTNNTDYLYYAEALKYLKEYEKSIEYYKIYSEKVPNDSRALEHLVDDRFYEKLLTDTSQFTINRLKMNSEIASFGITKYRDKYLFSSTGTPNPEVTQSYGIFEDNPYLDIFTAKKDENSEFIDVLRLEGEINSKYHDGPICYDNVNGQLYVTRNNVKRGRPVKDAVGKVNLKIYIFDELEDGKWSNGEEISFNSNDYSVAHPSITNDGNLLYFSSNMVGGYGGTDIYVSKRKEGGSWSEPLNLGPQINTEGDESFPFISASGSLYFSSDGHPGLGGLDVFKTEKLNGKWMNPINLAHPINSEKDDIGFMTEEDEKSGYFSSNRDENRIGDDIYSFHFTPLIKINAFVEDKYTMLPLEGVIAKIYDEGGFVVFEGESDENGYLEVSVIKGKCNYTLKIGDNLDQKAYDFDLNLCDDEYLKNNSLDLGTLSFGEMDYTVVMDVRDIDNNTLYPGAIAKVFDPVTGELLYEGSVDENGEIAFDFKPDTDYKIQIDHNDFEPIVQNINTKGLAEKNIELSLLMDTMIPKGIPDVEIDFNLALTVQDRRNNELIADVYAEIFDAETKELIFGALVSENAAISLALKKDRDYKVLVSHGDYQSSSTTFSTHDVTGDNIKVNMTLDVKTDDVVSVDLESIYYNFDKSDIRDDAKIALDKLVGFMKANPNVRIGMDSHTDSRGTNAYNMALSDRRERSALNYLLKAGIDASRLTNEHHGEQQLVNNCTDNVKCTKNAHQLNRRTTFTILNPDALASNINVEDTELEIALDSDQDTDSTDFSNGYNMQTMA